MTRYVPETFPHQWLPREARAQDLGADRAVVSEADGRADRLGGRPRALGDRGRGAERGGRPGRGRALHRDDLPDRRPRARGGLPGVRPRHRAEAQADPERDPEPLPRLAAPRRSLPRDRYFVFDRALENRRSLFREANIPRETELAELEQQYQKIIGAMTVTFRGQERTLAQMAPFLEETDRAVRQEAWELSAARRLQDRETLDDLFDQMIAAPDRDRARGGVRQLRRVRLPQPRAVRLRHRGLDPVPRGRRAGRGPADAGDPGAAPRDAGRRVAPPVGPGGRPAGPASARSRSTTSNSSPPGPRPSFATSTPSWATSSPSCATGSCSTWPTARARPPAAIRRRSRTSGCRSSS